MKKVFTVPWTGKNEDLELWKVQIGVVIDDMSDEMKKRITGTPNCINPLPSLLLDGSRPSTPPPTVAGGDPIKQGKYVSKADWDVLQEASWKAIVTSIGAKHSDLVVGVPRHHCGSGGVAYAVGACDGEDMQC